MKFSHWILILSCIIALIWCVSGDVGLKKGPEKSFVKIEFNSTDLSDPIIIPLRGEDEDYRIITNNSYIIVHFIAHNDNNST
jgi:hypothetical protein